MKKAVSLILAAAMMLSLSACSIFNRDEPLEPAAEEDVIESVEGVDTEHVIDVEDIEDVEIEPTEDKPETGPVLNVTYDITVPDAVPEFDADFYGQPVDAFTDDVLAANRDKLDFAPEDTQTEVLNRFTEYLNETEPGAESGSVKMLWTYACVYVNTGDGEHQTFNQLTQAPAPVFDGGLLEYSEYAALSSQNIESLNAACDGFYMASEPDAAYVQVSVENLNYRNPEDFVSFNTDYNDETEAKILYANYDEDGKTGIVIEQYMPDYGGATTIEVYKTLGESCGLEDYEQLLNVYVELDNEPKLSSVDAAALLDYLECIGIDVSNIPLFAD